MQVQELETRHSWTWKGCGNDFKETVGSDILQGTSQPCLSRSVEVLKHLGDQTSYQLIMRVANNDQESHYTLDSTSELSGSKKRSDEEEKPIFKMSNTDIDFKMDANILMVEMEELKSLIANGCAPLEFECLDTANQSIPNNYYNDLEENYVGHNRDDVEDDNEKENGMLIAQGIFCNFLDVILLLGEFISWISIYKEVRNETQDHILIFLTVPTVAATAGWIGYNWQEKSFSCKQFWRVLLLLVISAPSPIFL